MIGWLAFGELSEAAFTPANKSDQTMMIDTYIARMQNIAAAVPNNLNAQQRAATVLANFGLEQEAIDLLQTVLQRHPAFADGQLLLGDFHVRRKELDPAATCFEAAAKTRKRKMSASSPIKSWAKSICNRKRPRRQRPNSAPRCRSIPTLSRRKKLSANWAKRPPLRVDERACARATENRNHDRGLRHGLGPVANAGGKRRLDLGSWIENRPSYPFSGVPSTSSKLSWQIRMPAISLTSSGPQLTPWWTTTEPPRAHSLLRILVFEWIRVSPAASVPTRNFNDAFCLSKASCLVKIASRSNGVSALEPGLGRFNVTALDSASGADQAVGFVNYKLTLWARSIKFPNHKSRSAVPGRQTKWTVLSAEWPRPR